MTEQNKALVLRFVHELIQESNIAVVDELIADDFVDHDAPADQVKGPQGVKATFSKMKGVLADFRVTTEDMIAEADKVVTRHCSEATHVGPFLGFPATGKRLHWTTISIYRIAAGKIAERWGLMDIRSLKRQLEG